MPLLIETECDNFFGLHFKGIVFFLLNLSKISGVKNISFEIFVHHWSKLKKPKSENILTIFNNLRPDQILLRLTAYQKRLSYVQRWIISRSLHYIEKVKHGQFFYFCCRIRKLFTILRLHFTII